MFRKTAVIFVLALTLVLASLSLVWAQPVELTIAQGADAVTLDPHGQNDRPSARVRVHLYDTLVGQDEELNLVPSLATGWTQIDELTWEFDLRDDVTFHNGEKFTAEDVKYSLERIKDPATVSPVAWLIAAVSGVEVVDTYKVQIKTSTPFAPLLNHLAHPSMAILNKTAVEAAGDDFGSSVAVGTGAFTFVSWSSGSEIVLQKNPNYWGAPATVDRLVFRNVPEGTVRAIEVETGNVDISYNIEPIDEMRLEFEPNVKLSKHEELSTTYIGFNAAKAPYDNVLVRRAINHAVDIEAAVEFIYTGQAVRTAGPISSRVWGANPNLTPYEFSPEKAKELLAEAGYPDGFKTTIWTNDNPLRMQVAEMFQANLAEVGVDVEVQILPWATYLEDTAAGKHDMFILGWGTVTGDADYGLYSLFHSSQFGNAGNRTFWGNPRVDELLDLGRKTGDQDERRAAYYEAQEKIVEEAPWVFLIATSEVNGLRSNIDNFVPHPAGHHKLTYVVKK